MIHSLCELPADRALYERDFYVYLLDYGWEEELSAEMYRHFPRMAEAASRHGAVVLRGTVGHHFVDEVLSWHHVNGADARDLLPAILVTTKHPRAFREGNWGPAKQSDRLLLIPLRGVCRSPGDVAPLLERLFGDIQQKQILSQFDVAKRMVAGRDGATLDAVVLKPSPAGPGLKLSDALNFLSLEGSSRTGYNPRAMPGHRANARALPSQVDIAIVTILPEEYEAVRRLLNNVRRDPGRKDQPNQYAWVVGEIEAVHGGTYQVALGMTVHPGNTSGSLAIVKTIARWHPRYVLLVGIAGGFPRDQLGLGDVVVSKQIIGYEYGKVEHNAFNPRPDFVYQVDGSLLRSALSVSTTNWRRGLGRRPGSDRGKSKVLVGVVASGEKVIDDRSADFFAAVEKLFPKLLAVEMEGAGAAAAIQEARDEGQTVGFLMIRGISDMPPDALTETKKPSNGTKKNVLAVSDRDRWKSYAANAAAVFTVRFVSQAWPIPPRGELEQGITSSGPAAEDSTRPRGVIEWPRILTKGAEEVSSVASEPNSANADSQPRGSNIGTIPIIIDGDDYVGRLLNIKIDSAHLARQVSCRELMQLLNDRVATIPGISGISTSVEFLCSKRRFGKGGRKFSAVQRSALVDRIGGEVGVYVEFVGSTSKEVAACVGRRIEEIAGTAECMFLVSSAPSLVPVLRKHRRRLKVVVLELRHDLPSELRNEAYAALELEDDLPGLFSYSYPQFDVSTLDESTCAELYSEADDRHHNQLRVTRSGTVFLSKDEVGSENIDGLRFRFETFCAGNGYVGPIVASKPHYVQEQLADIQNAWRTGRTGYIDY